MVLEPWQRLQWKARIPRGFTNLEPYFTDYSRFGRGLGTESVSATQKKLIRSLNA